MASHNSMAAFWSGTDDANELGVPGVHVTFGRIRGGGQYETASSIVMQYVRYPIPFDKIADTTYLPDITFHEDVMTYIVLAQTQFVSPSPSPAKVKKEKEPSKVKSQPKQKVEEFYDIVDLAKAKGDLDYNQALMLIQLAEVLDEFKNTGLEEEAKYVYEHVFGQQEEIEEEVEENDPFFVSLQM